ncbi:MAG: nuclear transport factor 2 family protein [Acidobacteria bacterium]|nr:nuclear transport factor 2 family protein [Acidobacteriota bacterium]
MSENVNTIKGIYEAFGRGDIAAIVDTCTDNVLWRTHLPSNVPWSGNFDGKSNVPRFFQAINDNVQTTSFEPQEFVADGDTVVSTGTYGCKVTSTGKDTSTKWVFIWKVRDGKVYSYEQFHDEKMGQAFG